MGCSVSSWTVLKELLCIYRKQLETNSHPCASFFLLPTSTLYFWGLHTADAICKLPLQFSVKLLAGGKVSPKRMKEMARQYLVH